MDIIRLTKKIPTCFNCDKELKLLNIGNNKLQGLDEQRKQMNVVTFIEVWWCDFCEIQYSLTVVKEG